MIEDDWNDSESPVKKYDRAGSKNLTDVLNKMERFNKNNRGIKNSKQILADYKPIESNMGSNSITFKIKPQKDYLKLPSYKKPAQK